MSARRAKSTASPQLQAQLAQRSPSKRRNSPTSPGGLTSPKLGPRSKSSVLSDATDDTMGPREISIFCGDSAGQKSPQEPSEASVSVSPAARLAALLPPRVEEKRARSPSSKAASSTKQAFTRVYEKVRQQWLRNETAQRMLHNRLHRAQEELDKARERASELGRTVEELMNERVTTVVVKYEQVEDGPSKESLKGQIDVLRTQLRQKELQVNDHKFRCDCEVERAQRQADDLLLVVAKLHMLRGLARDARRSVRLVAGYVRQGFSAVQSQCRKLLLEAVTHPVIAGPEIAALSSAADEATAAAASVAKQIGAIELLDQRPLSPAKQRLGLARLAAEVSPRAKALAAVSLLPSAPVHLDPSELGSVAEWASTFSETVERLRSLRPQLLSVHHRCEELMRPPEVPERKTSNKVAPLSVDALSPPEESPGEGSPGNSGEAVLLFQTTLASLPKEDITPDRTFGSGKASSPPYTASVLPELARLRRELELREQDLANVSAQLEDSEEEVAALRRRLDLSENAVRPARTSLSRAHPPAVPPPAKPTDLGPEALMWGPMPDGTIPDAIRELEARCSWLLGTAREATASQLLRLLGELRREWASRQLRTPSPPTPLPPADDVRGVVLPPVTVVRPTAQPRQSAELGRREQQLQKRLQLAKRRLEVSERHHIQLRRQLQFAKWERAQAGSPRGRAAVQPKPPARSRTSSLAAAARASRDDADRSSTPSRTPAAAALTQPPARPSRATSPPRLSVSSVKQEAARSPETRKAPDRTRAPKKPKPPAAPPPQPRAREPAGDGLSTVIMVDVPPDGLTEGSKAAFVDAVSLQLNVHPSRVRADFDRRSNQSKICNVRITVATPK
eukprot:TRINITY_DN24549_c0_g2_i1.p1 TRINITY_DN24549_c0_g2~~TRINITY_DN24549_c0_g2_i1.p1  ORF type:complete len:870 (+),score=326.43 TRINITY_DN24549_c0_g2_i1:53-2611(+)